MKLSFNFDRDSRSFHMEPEDVLEQTLMAHLTDLCTKGATLKIRRIEHPTPDVDCPTFVVEMKVRPTNGEKQKHE